MKQSIINTRIDFAKKVQYYVFRYDATINFEVKSKRMKMTEGDMYIKRKNLNYFNYELYSNLLLFKYNKVLPLYQGITKSLIQVTGDRNFKLTISRI